MFKIPSITQIAQTTLNTFQRFPLALIAALIGSGAGILAMESLDNYANEWIASIVLTAMIATLLFTVLTLIGETFTKKEHKLVLMAVGILLVGLYYWSIPEGFEQASLFWSRHIFFCLAGFTALTWAPYWNKKISDDLTWEWNRQGFMQAIVTVFFGIVIFAGVSAAFFAIDNLFGVDIDGKRYGQLWALVVGVFGPFFFLSQLSKAPQTIKLPKPIPAFMNVFTKFILTPLAIGYFVILYLYTFKVLITGEWPKNVLGWLVICFSGVAVVAYFLWTPFWKGKIEKYRRLLWWGLLPQIAMLFTAISIRILDYSWTENRYFVVVLGLYLLGIALYFLIYKKALFRHIFIALTVVILFTQVGPWSGYVIGRKAQTVRLVTFLEKHEILQNGEVVPSTKVISKQDRFEMSDMIQYLGSRHGIDTLRPIIPGVVEALEVEHPDYLESYRWNLAQNVTEKLGFEYVDKWQMQYDSNNEYFSINILDPGIRDVSGDYQWMAPVRYYQWSNNVETDTEVTTDEEALTIIIKQSGEQGFTEIIELKNFLESLESDYRVKDRSKPDPKDFVYFYESPTIKVKVLLDSINGNGHKINSFRGNILWRRK
ncbi:MAG TPA: DUF4153 domain-containing protein [Candidatus Gracilibacteria bacterium]